MTDYLLLKREDVKLVSVADRTPAQHALIAIKAAYNDVISTHYSESAVAEYNRLLAIIKGA